MLKVLFAGLAFSLVMAVQSTGGSGLFAPQEGNLLQNFLIGFVSAAKGVGPPAHCFYVILDVFYRLLQQHPRGALLPLAVGVGAAERIKVGLMAKGLQRCLVEIFVLTTSNP